MSERKTREQVGRFLTDVALASEEDGDRIRSFLRRHKTKVPVGFGESQRYSASDGMTSDQFEKWYRTDLPEVGDVLWCDQMQAICLITGVGWNFITVGAVLTTDNKLSLEGRNLSNPKCSKATAGQISSLQKSLASHGWDWNPKKQDLVKRETPSAPRFVRLMVVGKQVGLGIFKGILPDNTLEMFCVKLGEEPVRILDDAISGDADGYSFVSADVKHRAAIQEELGELGYVWNNQCKRIQKDDARLEIGTPYYWLNAYLDIERAVERNLLSDRKKFIRGNYFRTRQGAEQAKALAMNGFKEIMLSEQE